MKSILLTTTAIVAFAGAAAADGHISMNWSGTATAGIARDGAVDAVSGAATIAGVLATNPNETRSLADIIDDLGELGDGGELDDLAAVLTAGVTGNAFTNVDADAAAEAAALAATVAAATGSAAADAGDFNDYAEINATVTGTVALDNGLTLSASMSVDAGTGYDFADDDTFDGAKTNGVGFDNVVLDAGAAGKLTFAPDDTAHLVDDDDDAAGDLKYENDFGIAAVVVVLDVDKDTDATPVAEAWSVVTTAPTEGTFADLTDGTFLTYTAPVAADVQWSAKVTAPVADIATVYAAFDEEGGNVVGASATVAGISLTASSKLEALEAEAEADRSNTIGASYTMGAITVGGSWNTIEDGNQWSINAAYSANGITVSADTNEGEEWTVTGSYALSDAASLDAGVNYTDDAFVGVSFSF